MTDDTLPKGAVPEDEMLALYWIAQRMVVGRGLPLADFLKIAERFATDNPPEREQSPSLRACRRPSHG